MNTLTYNLIALFVFVFSSCSKDDKQPIADELAGLELTSTLSNAEHRVELYTAKGKFETGYNEIYVQVKSLDGALLKNVSLAWKPMMHMTGMSHSSPASPIAMKAGSRATYQGHIIFQMASNAQEYWELSVDYTLGGKAYNAKAKIEVGAAAKRNMESFQGSDDKRYVMAMVEPSNPRVAINDMQVALYRMLSMTDFQMVDNYKISIDPRMPGMGNHGSPNNVNLSQRESGLYAGKLSLTMSGFWRINLQLQNEQGTVLKGEPVTEENERSSIYFELEF